MDTLHENQYTFMIMSRSVLLRMRNDSGRVVEETKAHILCSITFFFFRKSCRLWHNVEKYCRTGQATDGNMAHAHCMPDNKGNSHSQYVILAAFLLQQWLHERSSILCCTYIACLVIVCTIVVWALYVPVQGPICNLRFSCCFVLSP